MLKKLSKGFTLIELLVVIAIIAILAVLIIVRLNSASSDARNSRRKADLAQMRTAIELYKNKAGTCGIATNVSIAANADVEGTGKAFPDVNGDSRYPSGYLQGATYPKDPKGTAYYYQLTSMDGSCNYTITATNAESPETATSVYVTN